MRRLLLTAVVWAALTSPALAVHESHHGPFQGSTVQGKGFFMRVIDHTTVGIRFGWRADCERGSVSRVTRFRNVKVGRRGRFAKRNSRGVQVRGKIGFDPMGNPVFPRPFSFANNEAKGGLSANFEDPGKGRCRSGSVSWEASR